MYLIILPGCSPLMYIADGNSISGIPLNIESKSWYILTNQLNLNALQILKPCSCLDLCFDVIIILLAIGFKSDYHLCCIRSCLNVGKVETTIHVIFHATMSDRYMKLEACLKKRLWKIDEQLLWTLNMIAQYDEAMRSMCWCDISPQTNTQQTNM